MKKFLMVTIGVIADMLLLGMAFNIFLGVMDVHSQTVQLPELEADSKVTIHAFYQGPQFWLDFTPPVISNIQVTNVNSNTVNITWTTDELANSFVDYGLTSGYEIGTVDSSSVYVTAHSIMVTGLDPAQTYHFRVRSADQRGNSAASADQLFSVSGIVDVTPPSNVGNFSASAGDGFVVLTWVNPTDPDFAGVVIRRATEGYPDLNSGTLVYSGTGTSFVDASVVNGNIYYYSIFAHDVTGNYSSGSAASALPVKPILIAPPVTEGGKEEAKEGPFRVPEDERIQPYHLKYVVSRGALPFYPLQTEDKIIVLQGRSFTIIINNKIFKRPVLRIIATVNPSYLLRYYPATDTWEATIPAPKLGEHSIKLYVEYANNYYDELDTPLSVRPYGYVYEEVIDTSGNTKRVYLSDVKVTLRQYNAGLGKWELFNAPLYNQVNPIFTDTAGSYAFLVPGGRYYLEFYKAGYDPLKTSEFQVNNIIIDQTVRLFPALGPAEAPKDLLEKFVETTEKAGEGVLGTVGGLRGSETVQQVSKRVATPALSAVTAASALAIPIASSTSLLGLLNIQYIIIVLIEPFRALFAKKRKSWGVVYDSLSKESVSLAIVRLIDNRTGKIVQTTVTDKVGRYSFLMKKGEYRMTVTKPGYKFPSEYLKGKRQDFKYIDLYHGEVVKVKEDAASLAANIPIDSITAEISSRKILLNKFLKGAQTVLSFAGSVISLVFFIISPSKFLFFLLVFNVGMFVLMRVLEKRKGGASWGIIYDKNSKTPLKNAIVRIYDLEYNRLLGTKVTDENGRYGFMVGDNVYYLTVMKEGFEPGKSKPIDLRGEKDALLSKDMALIKCGNEGCKVVMKHVCDDKGCRLILQNSKKFVSKKKEEKAAEGQEEEKTKK